MNGEAAKQQTNPIAAATYLGFFVTGLIFLYLEPYNQDDFIRFHARQSIGFTAAWFAVYIVFSVFIAVMPQALGALLTVVEGFVDLAFAVFWLFLMYKAYTGERYRIPQLADIIDQVAAG
jgi:uncharacterized membrane protein